MIPGRPTGDGRVRRCGSCGRDVHFCDNLADTREHSQEGHCIAVDLGVIRRERDLDPPTAFLGQPSKDTLRASYEEGVDPVSQARLDARKEADQIQSRKR